MEDDITLDNEGLDDSVLAEEAQGDAIKKLRGKLKEAEAKAKEYLDSWQRAQAEFVNIRKRDEEGKQEFIKFAKSDVIAELVPVLDSLDMALVHGEKSVEPIRKQFLQILKSHGVEELDPMGEKFDPRFHEAIATLPTASKDDDHKVLEVLQKGYIMQGKTLRPAKVRVGEYEGN